MSRSKLEERVAELEKRVSALLVGGVAAARAKDWRRTRGAFTGDELMKQVFAEGKKIRHAERKGAQPRTGKKRSPRS